MMENKITELKEENLLTTPELKEVDQSHADGIRKVFAPMAVKLKEFEQEYSNLVELSKEGVDGELIKKARKLRLKMRDIRLETKNVKEKEKKQYLVAGRAIQSVYNLLLAAVTEREENLKNVEKHHEIQEQKRIAALQKERELELFPYFEDAAEVDLGNMEEDLWEAYFESKKQKFEKAQKEKAEAERLEKELKEKNELFEKRSKEVRSLGDHFDWDAFDKNTTEKQFNKLKKEAKAAQKKEKEKAEKLERELEGKKAILDKRVKEVSDFGDLFEWRKLDLETSKEEFENLKKEAEAKYREKEDAKVKLEKEIEFKRKVLGLRKGRATEYKTYFEWDKLGLDTTQEEFDALMASAIEEAKEAEREKANAPDPEPVKPLMHSRPRATEYDEEKWDQIVTDLRNIQKGYSFSEEESQDLFNEISDLFDGIIDTINETK